MSSNTKRNVSELTEAPYPFLISIGFLMGDKMVKIHGQYPHMSVEMSGGELSNRLALQLLITILVRTCNRLDGALPTILENISRKGSANFHVGKHLNPTGLELGGDALTVSEEKLNAESEL